MAHPWTIEVLEHVRREMTILKPEIEAYIRKAVQEAADSDWSNALVLMDMVHQELLTVKSVLTNMSKGEIPPSMPIQQLVQRLETLEQDHAKLKTDVRMLQK